MATEPLLPGIESAVVETGRLKMFTLLSGPKEGVPVVLVHGNVASSRFFEETMLALPAGYRAIAPDLRGYGDTEALPIDATRGLRDWSDDLHALVSTLSVGKFHLLGWSMGAGVALQYAIDHAVDLLSLTLVNPLSPGAFGGTKGEAGEPCYPDFVGSGGGTVNPEFLRLLGEKDRTDSSPFTALSTMNAFYFKPPFRATPEREQVYISSMLDTRIGEDFYPGDMTASENWPNVGPGTKGINNAMSPKWCNLYAFSGIEPKVPVLWVRGTDDQIVSDTSFFDFGFLGQVGAVPGWPGAEIYPPQPMVSQTRYMLEAYKANGGHYWERVIADAGHSPHVEKPQEFMEAFTRHLSLAGE